MLRRAAAVAVLSALAVGALPTVAHAAGAATVGATNVFPAVPGTTAPVGNVTVTEAAPGQLTVGDVVTVSLRDAANAATLHLTTTPVVSGTNGLSATLAVASSNATGTPLQDQVKVTITGASTGAFPGVLTVAQLNPAIDAAAATGAVNATVGDTAGLVPSSTVPVGSLVTGGTLKATFAAVTQPTLSSTGSNQQAGSVTIAEPAKAFFKTGDVITFRVRDVNGSADTIGLAATPLASGGAMTVTVQGLNGPTVQPNETGFKVVVDAQDPSNGSTSTLTVSNLVLNTAQAPSGPITLAAAVTTGATTEYIVPGRTTIANVGGATSTTSAGDPVLNVPGAAQAAGNLTITAAPGALRDGDTFSVAIQEAGVTFSPAQLPVTSLTAGNLSLTSAAATLDAGRVTATWTVQSANTVPSTIVVGPIYYDVAPTAVVGTTVSLKSSGGGSFTSQTVTNARLVSGEAGYFKTTAAAVPASTSPVPGADVRYTEPAAGALLAGNSALVLLSPYANQIAAYRTTFAAVPSATVTGTLVLGAPVVNSSTIAVTTANGVISAPAQTAVLFPVTAASTGTPAQVTFGNLSYQLGNYVPPGVLVGLGTANTGTGAVTPTTTTVAGTVLSSNSYADAINGKGLGSASAGDTTAPETYLDSGPANGSTVYNSSSVTFYFHSSEDPYARFTCTLISSTKAGDSSTIFENNCGQASSTTPVTYAKTYPSLADGHYTFYVQATDGANNTDSTPAATSFDIGFDATAPSVTVTAPATSVTAPLTVTFSEPVKNVSPGTIALVPAPAGGYVLTCKNGTVVVDCLAGPVTSVTLTPKPSLLPGQTYTLTVNPGGVTPAITDLAGNAVATTSKTFRASLVEQESSVAAKAAWRTVATTSASGGSYAVSHRAGAAVSFPFSGTSVTWTTVTGPAFGKATVYVDGVSKGSVNNYATATKYGVARTVSGLAAGNHVLKVVVAGVKGATAATDSLVAVDRLVAGAVSVQQNDPSATYAWGLIAATTASGGKYAAEDLAGAAVQFTFKGTSVTWWTVTAPLMGKATVYVDGVSKGTVDNYSSGTAYNVKRTYGGLPNAVHTIRVVVTGTKRSGATGTRIAVDRFSVL